VASAPPGRECIPPEAEEESLFWKIGSVCRQNETEMFSDHNETTPSIAAVLATSPKLGTLDTLPNPPPPSPGGSRC